MRERGKMRDKGEMRDRGEMRNGEEMRNRGEMRDREFEDVGRRFIRPKKTGYTGTIRRTIRPTDRRTHPYIEMRGRI